MFIKYKENFAIRHGMDGIYYIEVEGGSLTFKSIPCKEEAPIGVESGIKTRLYEQNPELYKRLFEGKLNKRSLAKIIEPLIN